MEIMEKKSGAKPNPILWFVFVFVIPTIVATTLAIVILGVAGIDVVSWAKDKASQVPVVSTWIEEDEEKNLEEQNEKAQVKIDEQNEEISQLNQEITDLEGTIDQLNQEILKLETSDERTTLEDEDVEEIDTIKKMSASFKEMKSKQAALIIEDLEEDIAIDILKELSNDVRGSILEAMDPSQAAHLTTLFVNRQ